MSRYVEVPMSAIEEMVGKVQEGVERHGGSVERKVVGREVMYEITHRKGAIVHFYTSAANGATVLRGNGKDAVRVAIGVNHGGKFRPTHRSKKILRTAPQKLSEEERVSAFIERCLQTLRKAYAVAGIGAAICPTCGAPMAYRQAKSGSEFVGCLNFPDCKTTRPC